MRLTRRSHVRLLSIICALAFASGVARNGQSDARAQTPSTQAASQSNATQQSNAVSQTSSAIEPHVFHLTVTDSKGNLISGLRREDLSVFDGKESRDIVSFDAGDVPVSVLFLVDISSSAFGENKSKLGQRRFAALKDAVSAFIEGSNASNEYFVTAFNRSPQVILDGSTDARTVLDSLDRLASADLKGFTAMYDALVFSLNKLATRKGRE